MRSATIRALGSRPPPPFDRIVPDDQACDSSHSSGSSSIIGDNRRGRIMKKYAAACRACAASSVYVNFIISHRPRHSHRITPRMKKLPVYVRGMRRCDAKLFAFLNETRVPASSTSLSWEDRGRGGAYRPEHRVWCARRTAIGKRRG